MAVAPTGAIYKALEFDGVSSRAYGVYITGEAVYNAPERDVKMITIPGRSGSFALDNGRFENITVTYPAGIFAETEADFRAAISDFRNFLCSRKGYVRLQDEYNPNEYRMAVYKSGLEVDPAQLRAGEFEITFDCKPQRWLTSGETAVSVTSGDTISNPTLFEASPLLEVEGYGNIQLNGYEIELENVTVGDIVISGSRRQQDTVSWSFKVDDTYEYERGLFNSIDTITISGIRIYAQYKGINQYSLSNAQLAWRESSLQDGTINTTSSNNVISFEMALPTIVFTVSEGDAVRTYAANGTWSITHTPSGSTGSGQLTLWVDIYQYADGRVRIFARNYCPASSTAMAISSQYVEYTSIIGNSTKSALGNPTYIDCDLGEAYLIDNGSVASLNPYIDLGSKLPTISPGSNTITYDNTITDLKIVPRWWKV